VYETPGSFTSAHRAIRLRGRALDRAALAEALMGPRFVVVRDVFGQHPPQMTLAAVLST
jgi:hypothetical protein